jgi:Protein of unknown function (DUF2637)
MTGDENGQLAARTVTGVVAGMVVATAAATVVGFWLSYSGLHDFAFRAGLRGLQAWAWPASVDFLIAAGEAGVTISALRRHSDTAAWVYLALGFGASVTGNVLHVDAVTLAWTRYAVAAVPPTAAMLALAALMRQVYQLAAARQDSTGTGMVLPGVPMNAEDAAKAALRSSITGGNPLSQNQLIERFGLKRAAATKVRQEVAAEANGHRVDHARPGQESQS